MPKVLTMVAALSAATLATGGRPPTRCGRESALPAERPSWPTPSCPAALDPQQSTRPEGDTAAQMDIAFGCATVLI